MGQAFRRATGRIGSSAVDATPQLRKPIERTPAPPPPPPPPPPHSSSSVAVDKQPAADITQDSEGTSRLKTENVLEDRDPQYDSMLSQMVGRIQVKPGGKLEMGEASVVESYKRPLPKLRNTKPESGRHKDLSVPPGTLKIEQLRQIILLHEGKSDEHDGPMDAAQISERFRVDVAQVQNILQFVSLPPEDDSKKKNNQE